LHQFASFKGAKHNLGKHSKRPGQNIASTILPAKWTLPCIFSIGERPGDNTRPTKRVAVVTLTTLVNNQIAEKMN